MLLFRSEEHVDRWCKTWRRDRGAVLTLDQQWELATAWFTKDRREPSWRRYTVEEIREIFAGIGLTSEFWTL